MNAVPDSIIVNSCQFTPVYLIQDPGATQGQSYILAQSSIEEPKPISDNLKSFYENSGNLDTNFVNVNTSPKPRILKKQESSVVGNNLKLASFLIPKSEGTNKQYVMNSVVLKPNVTLSNASNTVNTTVNNVTNNSVSTTSTMNTIPRINIDSKIVKLKDTTFDGTMLKPVEARRYSRVDKTTPKINKPKEIPPILQTTVAPAKHTSVQLLKLGETYHSLNELSDEQMKMVTQALKIFSNPEKIAPEPTYDPVTNKRFIYRVVSPKDLTIAGKNKIKKEKKLYSLSQDTNADGFLKTEIKQEPFIKTENKREYMKEFIKKDVPKDIIKKETLGHPNIIKKEPVKLDGLKKENGVKVEVKKELVKKNEVKPVKVKVQRDLELKRDGAEVTEAEDEPSPPKVTRSGRKVKLPKISILQGITDKQKKKKKNNGQNKNYVSCFQCAMEFPSLYLLQKHYEINPTHIPVKIHSNLFHCLLAIVKSGTDTNRTNIFIQQLEQLIVKLRSLLPCVLRSSEEEGKACTINEDVGSLLGVSPGKYHLDMEALNCVKDKDGNCNHSLASQKDDTNCTHSWITMNNEDILANTEMETEDCARINSVEKWPTVSKRVWKQKQQRTQENAKRIKLENADNNDAIIELGTEDVIECSEESHETMCPGAEQKADIQISVEIEPFVSIKKEITNTVNDASNTFKQTIENGIIYTADQTQERLSCTFEQPQEQITCTFSQPQEELTCTFSQPQDKLTCSFSQPQEISCTFDQSQDDVLCADPVEDHRTHAQFHSTHFDIRSSPIKPTSTIFRKFQINPELLAKYEAQIIRSIETVDKDHDRDKNIHCPTVEEVLQTSDTSSPTNIDVLHTMNNTLQARSDILGANEHVLQHTNTTLLNDNHIILQSNQDLLHTDKNVMQNDPNILHLSEAHALQTGPDILCVNENVLQTSQEVLQNNDTGLNSEDVLPSNEEVRNALVNDDTLQEMFRDEDLSAVKESFILDRELKDWILNRSNDEKSEDGFSRSNSLIQPALLHVKDDEIRDLNVDQKVSLPAVEQHDDSSVLNFLDSLSTDCLSYPGTEIRTNSGDFQIDLFL